MSEALETFIRERAGQVESEGVSLANKFAQIVERAQELLQALEGQQVAAHEELLAQERGQANQELALLLTQIQELAGQGKITADKLGKISKTMESLEAASKNSGKQ